MQNLRHRTERNALVEQALQFDIPARERVPTTTRSGRDGVEPRFAAANGCATGMPNDSRNVDIGGYDAASEPVTRKPRSCSIPASDAIAVPQIPMRWMCLGLVIKTCSIQVD